MMVKKVYVVFNLFIYLFIYLSIYLLSAVQPCGTFFLVIVVDCWDIATPPCGDDDNVVSKELSGRVGMLEK